MKVLVTDGSYENTLAIVRYLGRLGIEVWVIGEGQSTLSLRSKYCRGGVIGPNPSQENEYVEFLQSTLRKDTFDVLIPVGYRTTSVVSSHRGVLKDLVRVVLPDHESLGLALNKRKTCALAERVGVPYPSTICPQSLSDLDDISAGLKYPVVIKGILEAGGQLVRYPASRQELIREYHTMCKDNNLHGETLPMIQEYIRSDITYSFCGLYQEGACKRVFMFKEIRSVPVRGGSASYAQSFYDPTLKEYGMRLLGSLHWHGVANIEFRLEKGTGRLVLMEINPKFWASLEVALRAGVNFPYDLIQVAMGKDLTYSEEYERGLRFQFPAPRELWHLKENPKALPRVVLDFLDPRVKSNVWLSDFGPHAFLLSRAASALLRSRVPVEIGVGR
ncbi:MAG: ATP-grasp domain-containing protein [Dehalococcoidia bacterium]|nr:ATP-grasp domain-containing protein [Dehalococcoidia bacterium]